ncbi:MAG: (d)CMP kinase [Saprospiraceae bacterium]|nr:(d)CMP kinase [Saprospiraceae bacterium]
MSISKITIAVDGYAACGKSTLAKSLAKSLDYIYVDSGAMYRAVTLYFLDNNIDINNSLHVEQAIKNIKIHFKNINNNNYTFLNNVNVEDNIRTPQVSDFVSPVATISIVRKAMVRLQQLMGAQGGIVMDGRDIGTVVFKNAELKLFLTASLEERTRRRMLEWELKGIKNITAREVSSNLQKRDHIDSTREDSPLRKANDAIEIDNSDMTPEEQLAFSLDIVENVLRKTKINS